MASCCACPARTEAHVLAVAGEQKPKQKPCRSRHQQFSLLPPLHAFLPFSACWCLFAQVGATEAVNGSSVWSFVPSFAASFVRAAGKKSVRNRLKASRDAGLGGTSAWILVRGSEARGDWGCVGVGGQQGGEEERRRGVDHHHRQVGSGWAVPPTSNTTNLYFIFYNVNCN